MTAIRTLRTLFRLTATALLLLQAVSPQAQQPLTLIQIQQLIAAKTPEVVIRKLVADRGVAFQAGNEALAKLKREGTSDTVLDSVRQAPWRFTAARVASSGAGVGSVEMPSSFGVFRFTAAGLTLEGQPPLPAAGLGGDVWYAESADGLLVSYKGGDGTGERRLLRVNAKPLRQMWEADLGGASREPMLLERDALYVAGTKWLGRVDLENGEWTWRYELPPGVEARFGQPRIEGSAIVFAVLDSAEALAFGLIDGSRVRIPDRFIRYEIKTRINSKDGLTYVWIAPGKFMMGCSPGDNECDSDEKPARAVEIAKGYWLGESEVTQGAYQKVMGKNPSNFKGENLPVERVNWNDAKSYCEKSGGRLPTAAEWEYAARGGTTGARYGELDEIAWYNGNSESTTHVVKGKKANAYGLYDMLGNVWEWTNDDFSGGKEVRGGSWNYYSRDPRASVRLRGYPVLGSIDLGFRCAGE